MLIFTIVQSAKGRRFGRLRRRQYHGQIVAANGRELFRTSEPYYNAGDVLAAFDLLGDDEVVATALARLSLAVARGDHVHKGEAAGSAT